MSYASGRVVLGPSCLCEWVGGGCGKRFITDLADFGHRLLGQRRPCASIGSWRWGNVCIGRCVRRTKIGIGT
jgi:hypothetical protein